MYHLVSEEDGDVSAVDVIVALFLDSGRGLSCILFRQFLIFMTAFQEYDSKKQ